MKTLFYIVIKMKVHGGMIDYGRFYVGDDVEFASDLYQKLEGHLDPESQFMLHIDLIECSEDTSVVLQRKGCSLEELTENCRFITRETFKFLNLEK
jgi:hypothetical protein